MDERHVRVSPKKQRIHRLSVKKSPADVDHEEPQKISVLVANRSRLMRELLRSLLMDHSDIEIVDAVEPKEADLEDSVSRSHPRFVIVDFQDGVRFCNALMPKFSDLKILAIPAKKTFSRIYWADHGIHSQRVVTSIEGVLCALRETRWKLQSGMILGLQKAS